MFDNEPVNHVHEPSWRVNVNARAVNKRKIPVLTRIFLEWAMMPHMMQMPEMMMVTMMTGLRLRHKSQNR